MRISHFLKHLDKDKGSTNIDFRYYSASIASQKCAFMKQTAVHLL